jgi:hypothetical protein
MPSGTSTVAGKEADRRWGQQKDGGPGGEPYARTLPTTGPLSDLMP